MITNRWVNKYSNLYRSKAKNLTWYWIASRKWITRITIIASTNRWMIYNATICRKATRSRTWINATFIDACSICRTFKMLGAFWTAHRGASNIVRQTWAYSSRTNLDTFRIGTAWIRYTFWSIGLRAYWSFYRNCVHAFGNSFVQQKDCKIDL